jgi:hypothetical protein
MRYGSRRALPYCLIHHTYRLYHASALSLAVLRPDMTACARSTRVKPTSQRFVPPSLVPGLRDVPFTFRSLDPTVPSRCA